MRCLKCGAPMTLDHQQTEGNKVVVQTWKCTACGDRINEDMRNRWVKW